MTFVDPIALLLARIQFALNISFHILFPTLTIGMSWILVYYRFILPAQDPQALRHYQFWVKVFALSFALGAVSGITMSFQFATNWPGFMKKVGAVAGPLLASEVLSAFFLEASFLGLMLFAYHILPRWAHILSSVVVAVGTTLSAFWIIALNAWMHTPAGFHVVDGVVVADDWWAIVFNPSMPHRFMHTLVGSFLSSAFFMAALSALALLKHPQEKPHLLTLKRMLSLASVLILLQFVLGDLHGLNTLRHHPGLIAAIEGLWESRHSAPMVLFAILDTAQKRHRFSIEIPYLSSLYLTHSPHGFVQGMNEFTDLPPIVPVFWAFRIMVGTGILMALVSWIGRYYLRRSKTPAPAFLYLCTLMGFSGWLASLSGWYLTEIGRQPYLVRGLMTTAEAVSTTLDRHQLSTSLMLYSGMYAFLLLMYLLTLYTMARRPHAPSPH